MADSAAFLVDELLPVVPVRQWVLSLPHSLRVLCANDPRLLRSVLTVFVRTMSRFLQRRAVAAAEETASSENAVRNSGYSRSSSTS